MGDLINLNRARKAKARAVDKAGAAANRLAFGRTKAERERTAGQAEIEARRLDGAQRGPDSEGGPD